MNPVPPRNRMRFLFGLGVDSREEVEAARGIDAPIARPTPATLPPVNNCLLFITSNCTPNDGDVLFLQAAWHDVQNSGDMGIIIFDTELKKSP